MKLIVGLGNPGKEYENTRHNIGYIFIDNFADSLGIKIDKKKFNGLYAETIINNEKVILVKPLSYMNLSGEVVIQFVYLVIVVGFYTKINAKKIALKVIKDLKIKNAS